MAIGVLDIVNIFRWLFIVPIKKRLISYPQAVTLEFTTRCNSLCSYCGRTPLLKHGYELKDLTCESLEKILSKLKQCRSLKIVVIGGWGEPLLHNQFSEFVKLIQQELPRVPLKLFTNGVLLNQHTESLRRFNEVTVSLNSVTREIYAKNNCVDRFGVVAENISSFLKSKGSDYPKVNIQILKTPENMKALPEFTSYFSLNMNDKIIFQPMENAGGLVENIYSDFHHEFYPCSFSQSHLCVTLEGDAYGCCLTRLIGRDSDIYLGR